MSRDKQSGHYDAGGIETFEIIKAKLSEEEFQGYCKGNAIKYLCRSNHKGSHNRDLEKASNYLRWLGEFYDENGSS